MLNDKYLNEIQSDLKDSLIILIKHIEDKNSDAYRDFSNKIKPLKESIKRLESKTLSMQELKEISDTLGFKRIFPLLEIAEKLEELKNTVIKKQIKTIKSYASWGIDKKLLDKTSKEHQMLLIKSVLEGIFRKGIASSDREAWAPIMYNMSGRIIYDYVYAVINGWLHEDIIKEWFGENISKIQDIKIISIRQTAHDSNRIFKYIKEKQNISGEPDFLIEVQIKNKTIKFHLEVQHVTDSSRKKRDNLIQVPNHRVGESKKYGKNYLFLIPYVNEDDEVESIAVLPGPLEEVDDNHIRGFFISPKDAINKIVEFIKSL